MMTWQQLYITLILYFLVIQFPLVCSATIDIDTVIDDTIFAVVLACSIVPNPNPNPIRIVFLMI